MKKIILLLALVISSNIVTSQYCTFYEFEAENPEIVVQTLSKMMDTEWAKKIAGSKTLFQYAFNGESEDTHVMQFCFPERTRKKSNKFYIGLTY